MGRGKAEPTGKCWCGCGGETRPGSYFLPGHDTQARAALEKREYGNLANMLAHHGFSPENGVTIAYSER